MGGVETRVKKFCGIRLCLFLVCLFVVLFVGKRTHISPPLDGALVSLLMVAVVVVTSYISCRRVRR